MSELTMSLVEFRLHEVLAESTPPISQSELARQSGVSLTTINAMIQNKTAQVSLETLGKLADALHVEPGSLIARPLCAICGRRVFDQEKIADRSLYEVWCRWCGVYFIGRSSKAQLVSMTPLAQRLPIASDIQFANAHDLIGAVWGDPVPDETGALEALNDEIVDRFAMTIGDHYLDCERDLERRGQGQDEHASQEWVVTVDRRDVRDTGLRAMGMKKSDAIREISKWFESEFGGDVVRKAIRR